MNVADRAAELLKGHFGKGAMYNPNTGNYCITGAITAAVYYSDVTGTEYDARLAVLEVIKQEHPFRGANWWGNNPVSIEGFNDDGRTVESEALEVLRKAGRILDSTNPVG